jgi:cellulose synthase/poly-beta-1,6-N-acetylglucosamine synthase-like glycosyltransferase
MVTAVFWILAAVLAYSYVGYGLLIIALSRLVRPRRVIPPDQPLDVTLLIAAHNEEAHIAGKIDNALRLEVGPHRLQVVVVSDGSADRTAEQVRSRASDRVRLIEIAEHRGKIAALNAALSQIRGDVVVFSDANSRIRDDALVQMLRHFGDPGVGGVCGHPEVAQLRAGLLGHAEDLYWRYDSALKEAESRLGGATSAQGTLYAIRRAVVTPLPDAVADDLVVSLRVVAQGCRLVFEPAAVAEEEVTDKVALEFNRRVRSTERGWRGLMIMRQLLNPVRFGIYALQLFSHKVLRRLTPFLLVLFFVCSMLMLDAGPLYLLIGLGQILLILWVALVLAVPALARAVPGSPMILFLAISHAAMALGVCRYYRGHRSDRWTPVREQGR